MVTACKSTTQLRRIPAPCLTVAPRWARSLLWFATKLQGWASSPLQFAHVTPLWQRSTSPPEAPALLLPRQRSGRRLEPKWLRLFRSFCLSFLVSFVLSFFSFFPSAAQGPNILSLRRNPIIILSFDPEGVR